jgi:hypothetical protein
MNSMNYYAAMLYATGEMEVKHVETKIPFSDEYARKVFLTVPLYPCQNPLEQIGLWR